jgi:hypothetical protein
MAQRRPRQVCLFFSRFQFGSAAGIGQQKLFCALRLRADRDKLACFLADFSLARPQAWGSRNYFAR